MAFKPGEKRLPNAGRKKGTPNRNTFNFTEGLKARGFDILEEFMRIYQDSDLEGQRTMVLKAVEYGFAKPKAVEHSLETETKRTIDDVIKEIHERRDKNDYRI